MSSNGIIERTGYGFGYDQSEALVDWLTNNDDLNAEGINYGQEALDRSVPIMVQTVKQPRKAKRVHTNSFPQRGARKFTTAYRVISNLTEIIIDFSIDTEGLLEVEDPNTNTPQTSTTHFRRQMNAISAAKELARETHQSYTVLIDKVLTSGQLTVAEIKPGKSSPGEYRFTAAFKY